MWLLMENRKSNDFFNLSKLPNQNSKRGKKMNIDSLIRGGTSENELLKKIQSSDSMARIFLYSSLKNKIILSEAKNFLRLSYATAWVSFDFLFQENFLTKTRQNKKIVFFPTEKIKNKDLITECKKKLELP